MELIFQKSFENDLLAYWEFLFDKNPQAANAIVQEVYDKVDMLRDHPFAGQSQRHISDDCRHLVVRPLVVLYRVVEDRVELVRVLDGRRDVTAAMFEDHLD